jgi:hypothetical protein
VASTALEVSDEFTAALYRTNVASTRIDGPMNGRTIEAGIRLKDPRTTCGSLSQLWPIGNALFIGAQWQAR